MAQRLYRPQGESQAYALNENVARPQWFYGQLAGFEPNEHMPVLERAFAGRPDVNIAQHAAPQGYDFLRGLLYFLVIESHVLVLETGTLSTSRLERYLTWILKDRVGLMADEGHVLLEKKIEIEEQDGGLREVDEIVFRPEPARVSEVAVPENFRGTEREVTRLVDRLDADEKALFGIFTALGVPSADLAKLIADLPEGAELKAEVRLLVKERNRRVRLDKTSLNQILRNVDEDEFILRDKDGNQVGRMIELKHPVLVESEGNLLIPADVRLALIEAYEFFANNGYI